MLLGKRPRPRHPMRRTTSMAGIIPVPVATAAEDNPTDDLAMNPVLGLEQDVGHGLEFTDLGTVLPRNNYGGGEPSGGVFSGGYESDAATAHFLETCGLCKRRLFPGRDIYMYRGDTAFCSMECREKMMKQDERTSRHNHRNPCSRKPGGTDRMN